MGDQDDQCGGSLGAKVQETALAYAGAAWAFENVPGNDGGALLEGKIIGIVRGCTKGRDRYRAKWETGHTEKLKLDQMRRLIRDNQGTAITALP